MSGMDISQVRTQALKINLLKTVSGRDLFCLPRTIQLPRASQSFPGLPGAPASGPRGWLNFPGAPQDTKNEHAEPRKYCEVHGVFQDLGLDPNQDQMMHETISAKMSINPR